MLITLSYATIFFGKWQYVTSGEADRRSIIIGGSENQTQEKKQKAPETKIGVSSFSFLDLKSDTVNIETDKPYIFIGTWNEDCVPCKKAIRELSPMLDSIKNVETYYVYETHKFSKDVFIFSTKKLDELSNRNVIADYNQEFYNSLNMVAYPTFLIIDNENGEIIYMLVGYGKAGKDRLIKKLTEIPK